MSATGIQNIMAFRKLLITSLSLSCFFADGCRDKSAAIPLGPVEICYTSVRGASPRVVDYFIILSASPPSVAKSDLSPNGVECFVVPPAVEPLFKRKLQEILTRYNWSTFASLPAKSADEPFRRLSIKTADGLSYVELHEYNPADEFVNDERFEQFYTVVSEVRVLGETFGVRSRIENVPAAENLGIPLEQHK